MSLCLQFNEQVASRLTRYGYEPNSDHQLKLDNVLALMDLTVCINEITAGGPPYLFAEGGKFVQDGQVIDLTAFVPDPHASVAAH